MQHFLVVAQLMVQVMAKVSAVNSNNNANARHNAHLHNNAQLNVHHHHAQPSVKHQFKISNNVHQCAMILPLTPVTKALLQATAVTARIAAIPRLPAQAQIIVAKAKVTAMITAQTAAILRLQAQARIIIAMANAVKAAKAKVALSGNLIS